MRKLILFAGAAALALAAPVAAEKGGKGGGHGQGGGKPAHVEHGGGKGGGHGRGARGGKPDKAERQAFRAERRERAERPAFRRSRPAKLERQTLKRELRREERAVRRAVDERRFDDRRFEPVRVLDDDSRFVRYGMSCPPGLAKKGNGCLPPGQAKKLFGVGQRLEAAWFDGYRPPAEYRSFYHDGPDHYYRYDDDGYIYRADRGSDLISAIIPLFGGGFGVGQPLPAGYDVYNVPFQFRDTWYDTDDSLYRYGDNAIYRVDAESGLIEAVVALLAGDLNVGQPLPAGYDAYNLPLDYRDEYQDGDDYLYRYADGNIYQVDAETQIVQAIVEMLA